MQAGAVPHHRQQRRIREQPRLRKVEAVGIAPGIVHQETQQQDGNVVQHQADQDLVGVESGLEKGRNGGPGHAAQNAGDRHGGQQQRRLDLVEGQRHGAAGDGPHGQLALGADVPDIGAKPESQADGAEHDRGRLDEELRQAVERGDRRDDPGL